MYRNSFLSLLKQCKTRLSKAFFGEQCDFSDGFSALYPLGVSALPRLQPELSPVIALLFTRCPVSLALFFLPLPFYISLSMPVACVACVASTVVVCNAFRVSLGLLRLGQTESEPFTEHHGGTRERSTRLVQLPQQRK